ncbi:hypothetical protein DAERI_040087 [Deinococcus aerius]|uniref:Uncharacterized protein n=1 Tax=Deinococcus aerius TaxID=200253 RepID=A0A2I9DSA8_9DEIO|nr:hypothetical protein DAERI_040087 [Deinococcus aerius]
MFCHPPPLALPPLIRYSTHRWNGARVVEGARLESVYRGNLIEGSNPSRSAKARACACFPDTTGTFVWGGNLPGTHEAATARFHLNPRDIGRHDRQPVRGGCRCHEYPGPLLPSWASRHFRRRGSTWT